jgi:seryl-tRNA(Sec) selenium transferase
LRKNKRRAEDGLSHNGRYVEDNLWRILRSTEDDFQKLQRAWSLIRERGPGSTYVFTGLEHSLPLAAEELEFADDEIAPALSFERLKELALDHLGGSPETDDVAIFNRLTGATIATHLTLVKPGDVVIGVSATHSHPSVVRAAGHVGARFIDTAGLGAFREAIATWAARSSGVSDMVAHPQAAEDRR